MNLLRKYGPVVLLALILGSIPAMATLKVWTTNETIRAADLNSNFNQLKSLSGHGAGAVIVNADVASGAAIAYSKLNLTGGIVNADVNASAAIAYSKLSLGTSIVNADVSTSANIAQSKIGIGLYMPKAVMQTTGPCTGAGTAGTVTCSTVVAGCRTGTCTITNNGTTGQYRVNISSIANAAFVPMVTTNASDVATCTLQLSTLSATPPNFLVVCLGVPGGAAIDADFAVVVYDND